MKSFVNLLLIATCSSPVPLVAADKNEGVLIRFSTKAPKTFAGELVTDDDEGLTFIDFTTGRQITIAKADILSVSQPAPLDEVTRVAGLPAVTAWHLSKLVGKQAPIGKVAKITPQVVYLTFGSAQGIAVDQKLSVYRNKGDIKNPDTGEVLATERSRICELTVTEVDEALSKAKIDNDFEVMIQVGDEVEPSDRASLRVAVCPIYLEDGHLTNVGAKLGEDMTTLLVQRQVPVVERTVLETVLPELLAQQSILFDSQTAQKLGELAGASVVVTGKIVPDKNVGTAYIRAVNVQSGEILFALSDRVSLARSRIIATSRSGAAAEQFVGRWRIVKPNGSTAFFITLKKDFTANTSNRSNSGKWEIVDREARITWIGDAWKDSIRLEGDRALKVTYGPGKTWGDPPTNTAKAEKVQ